MKKLRNAGDMLTLLLDSASKIHAGELTPGEANAITGVSGAIARSNGVWLGMIKHHGSSMPPRLVQFYTLNEPGQ